MKRQYGLIISNALTTVLLGLYVHFKEINPLMPLPLFLMFGNGLVNLLIYYGQRKRLWLMYVLGKSQAHSLLDFLRLNILSHVLAFWFIETVFWYFGYFSAMLLVIDFAYVLFLISVKELVMAIIWEKIL